MKNDLKNLKKIFSNILYILTAKQKRKCVYIFFIILIGSILETIGVSMILPFVQALVNPRELLNNWFFGACAGVLGIQSNTAIIFSVGIGLVCIYFIKNAFLSYVSYEQISFRWKMQKELSTRMLVSYMKRPYTYFLGINSSQVLRGITDDVNSLYTVVENMFVCISNFLTIALIGIYLCMSDFVLAISVLLISGICFAVITFGFRKLLNGVGEQQRAANAEQKMYAYQAVNGIKEIDVMQRRDFFVDKYNWAYDKSMKANIKFFFLNACPSRIIEAVCISGIILVVCVRYSSGSADLDFISKMAVFVVAAFRILPLTGSLVGIANNLVYYWPGVEATYNNILEATIYEQERQKYIEKKTEDKNIESINGMKNTLQIKDILWKYPNSDRNVLEGLSLEIHQNESIAFIGSSGAGKTTLSDIILGLYQPQKGSIEIDGVDIYAIPEIWSKMIGYVPQMVFMIDDTIRANVTFGLNEEEIDDKKVWDALERAQLSDFVKNLPDGIHTMVGERGVKFSGGQRQRIAIARALYYNPEILVLDEATSALDNETESAVMESINSLQGHKTLIIIAHRLSTIRNCDKIYEILDGKAVLRSKDEVFSAEFEVK